MKDKKQEATKAITMRDVAQRAGVSPVVVSKVLHNKAASVRVSEATAERVRKAAIDLGYRVNVFARNFRARQTQMIGVLHGIGFGRPSLQGYFAALMNGIIEGAFKHGYSITLCPQLLGQSPEDAMSDGRFDGLVWYSTDPSAENQEMLMRCTVPLVLVHAHAKDFANRYPTVNCDNEQGIGLAVEHLVELGHREIGYATDHDIQNHESVARLEAFRHHVKRHGLNHSDDDILYIHRDGYSVDDYLGAGPRHTGIVSWSDALAAEFIWAAPAHDLRIPTDLSVIGFDSTSFCNELRPTLTSVSQPLTAMGERAIDLLVSFIGGDHPDPLEVTYPCGLDFRGSTTTCTKGDES